MTPAFLNSLRRPLVHRSIALLATVALLFAGIAQAAHFHKSDSARGADTHLQCLLCLHADRWAGPPQLPRTAAPASTGLALIVIFAAGLRGARIPCLYQARGPPLHI